jgi:hypothetical protein
MEKRQRMTLLGIAAAIAVAAVVIALVVGGGSDDDGDSDTSNTGTQAAQTETAGDTTQTTEDKPKPKPKPKVTNIEVEGGQPIGGVKEIKAEKGDTVRIDVTSDQADELHLHVYDVEKELQPGKKTRLQFKANIEGVIELELHESEQQIAEITVEP